MQLTSNSDYPSVQDMAKALVQHHKTHLHQVDILGTFYDIISLSKALPGFRNLKSVTISRFDKSEHAIPDFESATTRAFWAVIKALNNCPFLVESLTIDSLYYTTLSDIPMPKLGQIHEVLENLKQLSILKLSAGLFLLQYLPEPEVGRTQTVRDVLTEEIFSQTPNLEVLRIGNANSRLSSPPHFPLELDHNSPRKLFHWPHLKVLEMRSNASIIEDRLVALLERHSPSLRELLLKGFSLRAGYQQVSDWKGVFESIRVLLTLNKLVLSDLRIENSCGRKREFSKVEVAQLREWEKWVPRIM